MNFILVHFHQPYTLPRLLEYYKDLDTYHELMIRQIEALYPDDHEIHVITNLKETSTSKVIYHVYSDVEPNNYLKLNMFGLLDKPAMYLDNDIVLMEPFKKHHLVEANAFNLYQKFDVGLPAGFPSGMQQYPHYNSGLVWIPRPDKEITEALIKIKDRFLTHEDGWVADEYPINFFIFAFEMQMKLFPEVNVYRKSTKLPLQKCQSIHYAGVKELFLDELAALKGIRHESPTA